MILWRTSGNYAKHSSKLDQIRPWTAELAALECLENPHRLIMGEIL